MTTHDIPAADATTDDEQLKVRLLHLREEIIGSPRLSRDEVEDLKLAVLMLILHLNHRIADRVTEEV